MLLKGKSLCFDDVLLVPQYSDLASRSEADTSTRLGALNLKLPILSANMDTVTGLDMALAMGLAGGAGVLNRYAGVMTITAWAVALARAQVPIIPSLGTNETLGILPHLRYYTDSICIDVAHGDSKATTSFIRFATGFGFKTIIAGNVATGSGAKRLAEAGANVIKVGVGPGGACRTVAVTGHGVPQLQAIMDVAKAMEGLGVQIIADGGIKTSGDIVKALAAGADAVMMGSLLAGHDESLGGRVFRGMASREAQVEARGFVRNDAPEGVSGPVEARGPVSQTLKELAGGIRSGMSYSGARNLAELRQNAVFAIVGTP